MFVRHVRVLPVVPSIFSLSSLFSHIAKGPVHVLLSVTNFPPSHVGLVFHRPGMCVPDE